MEFLTKGFKIRWTHSPDDRALEESVPATSCRRPGGRATSRPTAIGENAETAGQSAGRDQGRTEGWLDSLVVQKTGEPSQGEQRHCSTDSEPSRCPPASTGALHGQR